eukprot:9503527-Pyramimonas_sp.AAC.1
MAPPLLYLLAGEATTFEGARLSRGPTRTEPQRRGQGTRGIYAVYAGGAGGAPLRQGGHLLRDREPLVQPD